VLEGAAGKTRLRRLRGRESGACPSYSWMMSIHIPFQKFFGPRGQYARGYRVVGTLRVT
jgi:hypothetical protein